MSTTGLDNPFAPPRAHVAGAIAAALVGIAAADTMVVAAASSESATRAGSLRAATA